MLGGWLGLRFLDHLSLFPHRLVRTYCNTYVYNFPCLDIQDEFKECLQDLVPLLLSPEHLVQKEISGQKVKVKELVQYFKCYMNLFSGDDLPEPKSMLEVSIDDSIRDFFVVRSTGRFISKNGIRSVGDRRSK